jgi:hypothetical protein
VTIDVLASLHADASARVPDPPQLSDVMDEAGRERLAAYYLYSALIAGLIGDDGLAPARWPPELEEPMIRLGLTPLAPRTGPGLDAQLTPAEQATRRSADRQSQFATLLVELINQGSFGPLCGEADSVRLAHPGEGRDLTLELIKGRSVVGTCLVKDHWELVAQHLAGAPLLGPQAETGRGSGPAIVQQLKETGIAHAVSVGTTIAVNVHPIGAAAGLGTRLVRSRIRADRDESDALRRVGEKLRALTEQADSELDDLRSGRSA